jgi:F0F1-type ATP synthase assembly protein I
MGFQMLGIILAGVFAGYFLDKWLHTSPLMVLILSLSSVVLAIYTVTKDLFRKK